MIIDDLIPTVIFNKFSRLYSSQYSFLLMRKPENMYPSLDKYEKKLKI